MNSCDLEISHDTRTPPPDKISHDRRDPWGRKHEGKTGRMIGRGNVGQEGCEGGNR